MGNIGRNIAKFHAEAFKFLENYLSKLTVTHTVDFKHVLLKQHVDSLHKTLAEFKEKHLGLASSKELELADDILLIGEHLRDSVTCLAQLGHKWDLSMEEKMAAAKLSDNIQRLGKSLSDSLREPNLDAKNTLSTVNNPKKVERPETKVRATQQAHTSTGLEQKSTCGGDYKQVQGSMPSQEQPNPYPAHGANHTPRSEPGYIQSYRHPPSNYRPPYYPMNPLPRPVPPQAPVDPNRFSHFAREPEYNASARFSHTPRFHWQYGTESNPAYSRTPVDTSRFSNLAREPEYNPSARFSHKPRFDYPYGSGPDPAYSRDQFPFNEPHQHRQPYTARPNYATYYGEQVPQRQATEREPECTIEEFEDEVEAEKPAKKPLLLTAGPVSKGKAAKGSTRAP